MSHAIPNFSFGKAQPGTVNEKGNTEAVFLVMCNPSMNEL